jgi:hypothetical protein
MVEGKETSSFLLQVKLLNLFMEKKNMRLVKVIQTSYQSLHLGSTTPPC